jgi:hypothetical protein
MKMEQMIVQYLYNNKKVTLQDIGTFTLNDDIVIPQDTEKDTPLPENAIQFNYNPKAQEDEGLIQHIVENSRKIKPLATSDLESFIILNKQFLNIGKPLVIEGLGTLQKTQDGVYAFTQAGTSHVAAKENLKVVTEKVNEHVDFASPKKVVDNAVNKKIILGILGFLVVGGLAYLAYFFITKPKDASGAMANDVEQIQTSNQNQTSVDTTQIKVDSINTILPKTTDSNSFYIVIKEFNNLAIAQKRAAKLTSYGNNVAIYTKDSITYKMRMPFKTSILDTLRVKDSLNKFFQAKTYVELP